MDTTSLSLVDVPVGSTLVANPLPWLDAKFIHHVQQGGALILAMLVVNFMTQVIGMIQLSLSNRGNGRTHQRNLEIVRGEAKSWRVAAERNQSHIHKLEDILNAEHSASVVLTQAKKPTRKK